MLFAYAKQVRSITVSCAIVACSDLKADKSALSKKVRPIQKGGSDSQGRNQIIIMYHNT